MPKPPANPNEQECPACNGTGYPVVMQPVRPGRKIYPAPCKKCGARDGYQRTPAEAALHINAIMSPIPTRVYKPATVTPSQTSATTLSGGSLICLRVTELLRAIVQPK
jgi:hypothetical protein